MDEPKQIIYYRIYGQLSNKQQSCVEDLYRKTYSLQYLKRIFYQRWNTNAYKFLVLEKITLNSMHGHVSSDAIHHDVILSRHKQKKQSWM